MWTEGIIVDQKGSQVPLQMSIKSGKKRKWIGEN